jgi:hypothetical protein
VRRGKSTHVAMLVLGCLAAVPALADTIVDAEIQCQVEYGSRSDLGTACRDGVKLASRAPGNVREAMGDCTNDFQDAGKMGACQRGVTLHTRLANQVRGSDRSSFSYTWNPRHAAVQVEVADYQVRVGDAEKSVNDCLRAFEGNSTPPSCLSGITVQHKPPE